MSSFFLTFPSTFCRSYLAVPGPPLVCDRKAHRQDSVAIQASSRIWSKSRGRYHTLYTSPVTRIKLPFALGDFLTQKVVVYVATKCPTPN